MDWFSIGLDNGLWPVRRQAITWTNAGLLSIGPLETEFSEIRTKIQNVSFTKMHLKTSSAKWQPFCRGGGTSWFFFCWSYSYCSANRHWVYTIKQWFRKRISLIGPCEILIDFQKSYFQDKFGDWWLRCSCEIVLIWMSLDLTDDK